MTETSELGCDQCGGHLGAPFRVEVAEYRHVFTSYEHGSPAGGKDTPKWGGQFCSLDCLLEALHVEIARRHTDA